MGDVLGGLGGMLFGKKEKAQPIELPDPAIPAVPAPNRREDTGAKIVVGSDAVKDKRVSGGTGKGGSSSSGGDVLGGLGRSGLSI